MYNVSVVGRPRTGKSSLCAQWRGEPFSESYCATIVVEHVMLEDVQLYDVPAVCRQPMDTYYDHTDVFVLVVRKDSLQHPIYDTISRCNRDASWLLILNGPSEFPKTRLYARYRGLSMARVDLSTGEGVTESLKILRELTQLHPQRPTTASLLDEVYQWIPTCV